MMNFIDWITNNYQLIISAIVALLSAAIAIAMMIPGEEPEKTLQVILDWISKFSKK